MTFLGSSAPQRGRIMERAALRGPRPEPNRKIGRPGGMPTPSTVSARWSAGLASNTLRRGRAEALAPQDRQPSQVL